MIEFLKYYVVAAGIFIAIDLAWIRGVARRFYRDQAKNLLREKPILSVTIVFYILYIVGIILFAVQPALDANSAWHAIGLGSLLGFLMYATYDLTNLATLKKWSLLITIVDMAWGTFITGAVALFTFFVFQ